MSLVRLIYFSEMRVGLLRREARIAELQRQCVTNNQRRGLSGALIYDDLWFIQALEGEPAVVDSVFQRILPDPRHANAVIMRKSDAPQRLFGAWAMAFARRSARNAHLFGRHWMNEGLNPGSMSPDAVIQLMLDLAAAREMRSLQPRNAAA